MEYERIDLDDLSFFFFLVLDLAVSCDRRNEKEKCMDSAEIGDGMILIEFIFKGNILPTHFQKKILSSERNCTVCGV